MGGALTVSSDSRAFTRGRSVEDRMSVQMIFIERAAWWTELARLARVQPHHVSLATSGAFVSDTGEGELPAWLEVAQSPVDEALALQTRQSAQHRVLESNLHQRIGELKKLGTEEGLAWSSASEGDFWSFVRSQPTLREPGLILMDNGNLRAVWRNAAGEQVALEFRGYSQVYFVFFARRPEGPPIARSIGEDSVGRIGEKIAGDNLTGLLRGEG